jgi:hypothetical protein
VWRDLGIHDLKEIDAQLDPAMAVEGDAAVEVDAQLDPTMAAEVDAQLDPTMAAEVDAQLDPTMAVDAQLDPTMAVEVDAQQDFEAQIAAATRTGTTPLSRNPSFALSEIIGELMSGNDGDEAVNTYPCDNVDCSHSLMVDGDVTMGSIMCDHIGCNRWYCWSCAAFSSEEVMNTFVESGREWYCDQHLALYVKW